MTQLTRSNIRYDITLEARIGPWPDAGFKLGLETREQTLRRTHLYLTASLMWTGRVQLCNRCMWPSLEHSNFHDLA